MKLLPMGKSLATHALLLGLINAVAVLTLGLVMMEIAYHRGLVDFLQAPIQERILSASRSISLDLLENQLLALHVSANVFSRLFCCSVSSG